MARTIAVLGLSCALVGCVSEQLVEARPEAGKVTIVKDVDRPLRCKTLGDIHGRSRSEDEAKARVGAQNDLKNQAAAMKANYALVEIDRAGNVGKSTYKEVYMAGKALKCEDIAPPEE